jgi:hypothetical protein
MVYLRQQREKHVGRVKDHLKTEPGCRDVDIHPDAASILCKFIGNCKSGFLFHTSNGTMFDPGKISRDSLAPFSRR